MNSTIQRNNFKPICCNRKDFKGTDYLNSRPMSTPYDPNLHLKKNLQQFISQSEYARIIRSCPVCASLNKTYGNSLTGSVHEYISTISHVPK